MMKAQVKRAFENFFLLRKKQTGFAWSFFQPLMRVCRCAYIPFSKSTPPFSVATSFSKNILQVRINKILNECTFDYHPSLSGVTLRIHSIFRMYTPAWLGNIFKFMVLRLLENAFVSQKIESVRFYLCPISKNVPQALIITTPGRRKLTISPKKRFLYFSSVEREEDYEAEKMTKIKLTRLSVTGFDKFYHFCNHCIFGFCSVVP